MSSLISKKRIFFEKPSLGDVSQYTYLETNTSTNYLDSDGVPVIYDKFAKNDLYSQVFNNEVNNAILQSNIDYTQDSSVGYPLRFNQTSFLRINNIVIENTLGGGSANHTGIAMWVFDSNTLNPYDSNGNIKTFELLLSELVIGHKPSSYDSTTSETWGTAGIPPIYLHSPGSISHTIENIDDSDNADHHTSLNGVTLFKNITTNRIDGLEIDDIDGKLNQSWRTGTNDDFSDSNSYWYKCFNPTGTGTISPLLSDDNEGNDIHFVFYMEGDQYEGEADTDYLRNIIQVFTFPLSEIFTYGETTTAKNANMVFGFQDSHPQEVFQHFGGSGDGGESEAVFNVSHLDVTINTIGVEEDEFSVNDMYSSFQPLIQPQQYFNRDNIDIELLQMNPFREIGSPLPNYVSPYRNEFTDFVPVPIIRMKGTDSELQAYYADDIDRQYTSAPAIVDFDYYISEDSIPEIINTQTETFTNVGDLIHTSTLRSHAVHTHEGLYQSWGILEINTGDGTNYLMIKPNLVWSNHASHQWLDSDFFDTYPDIINSLDTNPRGPFNGWYLKVGDEIMEINSLTGTTAYTETQTEYYIQMVVKRAQLGTSQATHTAGETVEVYDGPPTPQEITTTTETVVQAAGPLGNGDELVDRKLFNTTIPTSKYMYYVIDWDDKEDKIKTWDDVLSNFPSNTNQLLNLQNQGLYLVKEMGHPNSKSYSTPGIKTIKAVMFNYQLRSDGLIEPLRWKFTTSRFYLDIPINQFPDFAEVGGADYTTIPWPNTTVVIGGISENSKYTNSIEDVLTSGKIGDTDIIDKTFLMKAQENNRDGKIGKNIEKMDLEQVRFFNQNYDLTQLLFSLKSSKQEDYFAGRIGISSVPMFGYFVSWPFPADNMYPGNDSLTTESMAIFSLNQACATAFGGESTDYQNVDIDNVTIITSTDLPTNIDYNVYNCYRVNPIVTYPINDNFYSSIMTTSRQCSKIEYMLKKQNMTTADIREIGNQNVDYFVDSNQDGEYDLGTDTTNSITGDDVFYTQENYPFAEYTNTYGCDDNFLLYGDNLENVSEIRTICNDGTIVTICDSKLSIGESTTCNIETDLLYNSGNEACESIYPMTKGMTWSNKYTNVSMSLNQNINYWGDETNKFPEESSVGQIFIDDNSDLELIQDCKFELNTGNLTNKAIDDSTGNGNKGLLIGDYKIKKQQKGIPMRRDSFIKVPKKASNEDGAL